jgi:hypothetical protein
MTTPIVSVNIMGGLGNQLFQIAAAYAYAKQTNGQLQIVRKMDNGNRPVYWDSVVYRIQPYLVSHLPSYLEHWHEPLPTQYREIGALPQNGIYLNGYLQSSKYYGTEEIKQEIKALFRPHPRLQADIYATYSRLIENKERVIVVHARRTDYITYRDVHGPLEGSYYKETIGRMMKRIEQPIFLLCSDDSSYWNEIKNDIPDVFNHEHIILNHESDIRTFALLQQFQNFIMSNSTFIWWCVWMSSAKHVLVPSKWFGPAGPAYYEDIYEENWERI